ncbi:uncharacterized protein LOC130687618 [Daphnia carinata]|uniref:uncharacterized protein LOC130687618 n=1 Tax=Daphnia carinata TaxID=120202 RepID=UPI0025797522|nr:uncharacterized protein LOC130687618 [Daphnia carinata]
MGKKKEYNLSEIDTKQAEDASTDKKESFTVQEYDAIVNDGVTDQPCKQSASDDGDKGNTENDSSNDEDQTNGEEENETIPKQTDCEAGDNVELQEINGSQDKPTDNSDNTATTEKQIQTSKAEEEYTTIDLEETTHAPNPCKTKPVAFWLRKNLFLIIGISFVIALIAIISIAASSKRGLSNEEDELMARKANIPGFKPATNDNTNNKDNNSEVEVTTPTFTSTESDIAKLPWTTVYQTETSQSHEASTIENTEEVVNGVTEDDENYEYPDA